MFYAIVIIGAGFAVYLIVETEKWMRVLGEEKNKSPKVIWKQFPKGPKIL